eukprot:1759924-Prymnesium_polylepis.1
MSAVRAGVGGARGWLGGARRTCGRAAPLAGSGRPGRLRIERGRTSDCTRRAATPAAAATRSAFAPPRAPPGRIEAHPLARVGTRRQPHRLQLCARAPLPSHLRGVRPRPARCPCRPCRCPAHCRPCRCACANRWRRQRWSIAATSFAPPLAALARPRRSRIAATK